MYVGKWIGILYSHSTWLAHIYYLGEDTSPHFLHHYSYLGFLLDWSKAHAEKVLWTVSRV